jgi:Methyltransferase domain
MMARVTPFKTLDERTSRPPLRIIFGLIIIMLLTSSLFLVPFNQQEARLGDINHIASEAGVVKRERELLYATLLQNADRKIAERRAWLSEQHSEGQQFGKLENGSEMWYLFSPVLPCLWTLEKEPSCTVRHDGGKWLCGLHELHAARKTKQGNEYGVGRHYEQANQCIIYSMGSADDFSFEERVRQVGPGCEIHTFDPTVLESGKGKQLYDAYHGDYGFGGTDGAKGEGQPFAVKSIRTIMRELGHTHVDFLKVDVEGYEWEFFTTVDWSLTKVGQLLIEVHPMEKYNVNAKMLDLVFTKLEMAGFRLISLEPVTYTKFGQVELVFLHKDWRPDGKW